MHLLNVSKNVLEDYVWFIIDGLSPQAPTLSSERYEKCLNFKNICQKLVIELGKTTKDTSDMMSN